MKRFWSKVDVGAPAQCWPWLAKIESNGYGKFSRGAKSAGSVGAHRMAWELTHGREPAAGMQICHRCDNRSCCNPAHLYEGTHVSNMNDRRERSRTAKGNKLPQAKLTPADVLAIRENAQGLAQRKLAAQYGVSHTLIGMIQRNEWWRHV